MSPVPTIVLIVLGALISILLIRAKVPVGIRFLIYGLMLLAILVIPEATK